MNTTLKPNQIIVVGTNMNGHHYGGAAAQAHRDFGLKWGQAETLNALGEAGYVAQFGVGYDECVQIIESYLEGTRQTGERSVA